MLNLSQLHFTLDIFFYYPESFYKQPHKAPFTLFLFLTRREKKKDFWMVPFRDDCYVIIFRTDRNVKSAERSEGVRELYMGFESLK